MFRDIWKWVANSSLYFANLCCIYIYINIIYLLFTIFLWRNFYTVARNIKLLYIVFLSAFSDRARVASVTWRDVMWQHYFFFIKCDVTRCDKLFFYYVTKICITSFTWQLFALEFTALFTLVWYAILYIPTYQAVCCVHSFGTKNLYVKPWGFVQLSRYL